MPRRTGLRSIALLLISTCCWTARSQEIYTGVWAAEQRETLPLPTQGYQAYLVGELHGLQENEEFQIDYLRRLQIASGLRDVAIEERAVYENDAQAFVDSRSDVLPPSLCLRAGVLDAIRRLNDGLSKEARIRVHLIDVDSPAAAIRQHLESIKKRLNANSVSIPKDTSIKRHGLETVAKLKLLTTETTTRSDLRTIEFSIRAFQQGLEFDTALPKGSPYLNSREQAIASNIEDLIRLRGVTSLLVLYGSDHVSRTPRKDGGPKRNEPFAPMALRLERSGIKAFSVVTFPLEGTSFWRGHKSELPWTASDGHLASGETLDHLLAALPDARYLYVDTKRQRVRVPSQDISNMAVDAFVLFRSSKAMIDRCRFPSH